MTKLNSSGFSCRMVSGSKATKLIASALLIATLSWGASVQAMPAKEGGIKGYLLESFDFSVIVDKHAGIEFWPAGTERAEKKRDRNFMKPMYLQECDGLGNCRKTALSGLDWDIPTEFGTENYGRQIWTETIEYVAIGKEGENNFDSIKLTYVLGYCPDMLDEGSFINPDAPRGRAGYLLLCISGEPADELPTVAFGLEIEGHTPAYGADTQYSLTLSRSTKCDMQVASNQNIYTTTNNLSPINDLSRGRVIDLNWEQNSYNPSTTSQNVILLIHFGQRAVGAIGAAVGVPCHE